MGNPLLLSLCIPTNGAVKWVMPVIESIYAQGYDLTKFEVVITDNGKDSQLSEHISKLSYPNLRYRQTKDEGFLNLVTCLKDGRGLFCKMINHRSILLPGTIEAMIALVERYKDTQPLIYCSDGRLNSDSEIIECPTTNDFVYHLSYWCSWSAGIGFWQKDLSVIDHIELNELFPNMSLLFGVRSVSDFVIWNREYQNMGDESGKGGYDVFHTFAVVFLDFMKSLCRSGRISGQSFDKVKKELYQFLQTLYLSDVVLPTNRTFVLDNIKSSMSVYYGKWSYYRMVGRAWLHAPVVLVKRWLGII